MEKEKKPYRAHILAVAYPIQGHINPILQFSKRLQHKGMKSTLVTTRFISKKISHQALPSSISIETISDGFDEGGRDKAETLQVYLDTFQKVGSETLSNLIENHNASGERVDCIVYDPFLPWCLDVAKKFGLVGAVFFTQSCAVDSIYFHLYKGVIKLPLEEKQVMLHGLPPLEPKDLPSFLYNIGSYPAALDLLTNQFCNIGEVDWVLCNTFSELEFEVVESLGKIWPLKTIGPTIPSTYLDKQLEDDIDYGFSIFKPNIDTCIRWLNDKPKGSVVYVSFGSVASISEEQMEELYYGLERSSSYYLWVVRAIEEAKLPKDMVKNKGFLVTWCPQLEVLAHEAIGCFITHCGWNSTLEALSLGVPMVGMPQWCDQTTNAKFVKDAWKVGVVACMDEKGLVRRGMVEDCVKQIMEGEIGKELKVNAGKWSHLAKKAMSEGGSSDENLNEFVASLVNCKKH